MALSPENIQDLQQLNGLVVSLAGVLNREEAIAIPERLMESATVDQINESMRKALDQINLIVNPV